MKLLDKREIDVAKAAERHMEIEEGRRLAVRVDSLRELFSKEQGSLAKYRDETMKEALKQLAEVTAKRDQMIEERLEAEEQRNAALKPVDDIKAEADRVLEVARATQARAEEKEGDANIAKKAAEELLLDAKLERDQLKGLREGAVEINLEAQRHEKAARERLRESEKFQEEVKRKAEAISEAADVRDEESKRREAAVIEAERKVAHDAAELGTRERDIIDREERLKKSESLAKKQK